VKKLQIFCNKTDVTFEKLQFSYWYIIIDVAYLYNRIWLAYVKYRYSCNWKTAVFPISVLRVSLEL